MLCLVKLQQRLALAIREKSLIPCRIMMDSNSAWHATYRSSNLGWVYVI